MKFYKVLLLVVLNSPVVWSQNQFFYPNLCKVENGLNSLNNNAIYIDVVVSDSLFRLYSLDCYVYRCENYTFIYSAYFDKHQISPKNELLRNVNGSSYKTIFNLNDDSYDYWQEEWTDDKDSITSKSGVASASCIMIIHSDSKKMIYCKSRDFFKEKWPSELMNSAVKLNY